MKFTKPIKIYLFKDKDRVDVSVKVNDTLVNGYRFTVNDFEKIINNWQTGIEFEFEGGYAVIEYKKHGPRPERKVDPYVRFSISIGWSTFHHRLTYDDMLELEKEYFYQKNNKMYWDE